MRPRSRDSMSHHLLLTTLCKIIEVGQLDRAIKQTCIEATQKHLVLLFLY